MVTTSIDIQDYHRMHLSIQRTFPAPEECFLVIPLHQINLKKDSSQWCFHCRLNKPRCFCWCFRRFCHVVDYFNFRLLCLCLSTANKQGRHLSDWSVGNYLCKCALLVQYKQDGCWRWKNMQSILFSRKELIGRSCLSFFMDSNFSLVATFVMAGNSGRDCENFSPICEGLKSARSLCGSLRM